MICTLFIVIQIWGSIAAVSGRYPYRFGATDTQNCTYCGCEAAACLNEAFMSKRVWDEKFDHIATFVESCSRANSVKACLEKSTTNANKTCTEIDNFRTKDRLAMFFQMCEDRKGKDTFDCLSQNAESAFGACGVWANLKHPGRKPCAGMCVLQKLTDECGFDGSAYKWTFAGLGMKTEGCNETDWADNENVTEVAGSYEEVKREMNVFYKNEPQPPAEPINFERMERPNCTYCGCDTRTCQEGKDMRACNTIYKLADVAVFRKCCQSMKPLKSCMMESATRENCTELNNFKAKDRVAMWFQTCDDEDGIEKLDCLSKKVNRVVQDCGAWHNIMHYGMKPCAGMCVLHKLKAECGFDASAYKWAFAGLGMKTEGCTEEDWMPNNNATAGGGI